MADQMQAETGCARGGFERSRAATVLAGVAIAVYMLSMVSCVWYGALNADEGWTLNAARLVMRGHLPMRDFAYTQGPLLPYLYGALLHPFGVSVLSGRLLSAALGLGAFLLAMSLASRLASSNWGGAWAGLFAAAFFSATYHNTITKTHALTAFLLVLSLHLATQGERGGGTRALLGLVAACLAAATRIAAAPCAALVLVYLAVRRANPRWLIAVSVLAVVAAVAWVAVVSPEKCWFNLVQYHLPRSTLRQGQAGWGEHAATAALAMLDTLWRFGPLFVPVAAALVWGGCGRSGGRAETATTRGLREAWLLVGGGLLVFCAHLPALGFGPLYFSMSLPVIAAGAGAIVAHLGERTKPAGLRGLVFSLCGAAVLLGGLCPSAEEVDDFCQVGAAQLPQLRRVAARVRALVPPGKQVVTFHTYLAVEARRAVPVRYSMSVFSYYPYMRTGRCLACGVVNDELLLRDLADPAVGAVALTTIDKRSIRAWDMVEGVLSQRWRRVHTEEPFGQFQDRLEVFVPKAEGKGAP